VWIGSKAIRSAPLETYLRGGCPVVDLPNLTALILVAAIGVVGIVVLLLIQY
jgi:hypothetical protein